MLFLALCALIWWALGQLEADTDRLVAITYQDWAGSVAQADGLQSKADPDLLAVGLLTVHGGETCDRAVRRRLGHRLDPDSKDRLIVSCGLSEGRAHLKATVLHADGSSSPAFEAGDRLPGALALFPPLFAIVFAFLFRRVLTALFIGVALGALMLEDFAAVASLERMGERYVWGVVSDPFTIHVCLFTLALIGMVNVCIRMGGMQGVIDVLSRFARGVRSTQAVTGVMGLAVFFDDYANTVVVGGSARPLTDSRRISREKLAYIVDSTAAPISGIALVSTWIAIEVKAFADVLPSLGVYHDVVPSGYAMFLEVLPYRFYCLFAVALVFMVALMGRDFGPMLAAERRARRGGRLNRGDGSGATGITMPETELKEGVPCRWANGVIPISVVILVTLLGSIRSGAAVLAAKGEAFSWTSASDLIRAFTFVDNSTEILFYAALVGSVSAILMASAQRILGLREAFRVWIRAVLGMLPTMGILILAIALQRVVRDLHAAHYLAGLIGDIAPRLLPLVVFLLAGGVAFATGTSWGTMLILMPFAMPVGAALFEGMAEGPVLLFLLGAAVLDGAIFGDHCSVISDTTVMSSIASGCDHTAHVRTQIPYAMLAMGAAALAGYSFVAWTDGATQWLCYPLGLGVMAMWLRWRGELVDDPAAQGSHVI